MTARTTPQPFGPGFHGKLPSRGDFVTYGLKGDFLDFWDDWLAGGLESLRGDMGGRWEALHDACPVWRFVLPPGLAGTGCIAGVMMPSHDKVTRRFPFVIVCELPAALSPLVVPAGCRIWFDMAEAVARRLVLGAAEPTFARRVVNALGVPLLPSTEESAEAADTVTRFIGKVPDEFSLWWTRGSGMVAASIVAAPRMPSTGLFAAFLDGDWATHGWLDLATSVGAARAGLSVPEKISA